MNKRKTTFTAVIIGAGIMAVIDRIRLHNRLEDLEERTDDIGRCHNDFCLMQERYNKNTDEQLAIIQRVFRKKSALYMNTLRGCQRVKKMGGKIWHMYQSLKT